MENKMIDIELLNHLTNLPHKNQEVTIDTVEIMCKVYCNDDDACIEDKFFKDLMETTQREFYIKVGFNTLTYIFKRTDND